MRRLLLPLFLVIIGLGFIVAYLTLANKPAELTVTTTIELAKTRLPLAGAPTQDPPTAMLHSTSPPTASPALTELPTQTAQPIIPTRTPRAPQQQPTETIEITATSSPKPTMTLAKPDPCPLHDCLNRVGVSGRKEMVSSAKEAGLPFGHYLNWWAEIDPPEPDGVVFWQMVSISAAGPSLSWEALGEIVDARPQSIWIVGNEPDIAWQDNVPAEKYAQIYHDVYAFIKDRDPTARLAIAGVGQPTPLRLAYLDLVLDTYRERYGEQLPIDIWTIHAFVLREQQDSWGVGIPPGMEDEAGELYEIEDHNNLALFRQNLINFRSWLAERGYRDRPLAVTEFGILHPAEYGFPPDVVADFLVGAFDFFASATNETGYPADDNRLVQWWFWYSVYDGGDYPTGNLFDPTRGQLTSVGEVFAALAGGD